MLNADDIYNVYWGNKKYDATKSSKQLQNTPAKENVNNVVDKKLAHK